MIERENGIVYTASLSGGKDSTAMVDLLLKNGYPLDYILFYDTLAEFEEMYEYIDKLDAYFNRRYKIGITRLKPVVTIDEILFQKVGEKSKNAGKIKGAFLPQVGFCDWRLRAKMHPRDKWIKERGFKQSQVKSYVGITIDESHRCNRKDPNLIYPLVDIFKMSENDCKQYLINEDMENPLYRHFSRTGCGFCPAQSKRARYQIYKHYPKVWAQIKEYERRFLELEAGGESVYNKFWFNDISVNDLEKEFKKWDAEQSLWGECGLDDEPVKDCFCKF